MENPIVHKALERLAHHTRITGKWRHTDMHLDGRLELRLPAGKVNFYIEVKREIRQYQLPQLLEVAQKYQPFMVVANNIFPALKEQLRDEKIAYLDTAGNVFVNTGDHYVWIEGHKQTPEKKTVTNRAFTKTGLKTVFYLLLRDEAINMTYRKLADTTNVALGNIKNVIEGLNEAGFILKINENRLKLQNKKELLQRWMDGYRETLKPALLTGSYKFWNKDRNYRWQLLPFEKGETAWGGEAGGEILTNYLNAIHLTLYTNERVKLVTKWTLIPDETGNLKTYEKFWKDEEMDKHQYAPPLLVYVDLLLTGDPRCKETAKMIYDQYLINDYE